MDLLLAVDALARDLSVHVIAARRARLARQPQEVQVAAVARAVDAVGRVHQLAAALLEHVAAQRDDRHAALAAR